MTLKPPTLVVLAIAVLFATQDPTHEARDAALERIYREYTSLDNPKDGRRLVQLDQQLRAVIPRWSWEGPWMSSRNRRPAWETIGVSLTLFEPELLSYSGKLLVEAHQTDPNVARSNTLYATVFGMGEADGTPPNLSAAQSYLREFPNGPFAADTHLALANLYSDLFKIILSEEAGQRREIKNCFRPYLTAEPLPQQRVRAQGEAVAHYEEVIQRLPKASLVATWLAEMRRGISTSWHYCPD